MKDSSIKNAANRLGISAEEYTQHLQNGEKWCYKCQTWKVLDAFNREKGRGDGRSPICTACNQVGEKKLLTKDEARYENDSEIETHLLAYFAGVIDSDGYITIGRKNGPKRLDGKIPRYYDLKVGCNQVDQTIPSLLRETFGGNFYKFQTKRQGLPWFMWYCSNQQAAHCCSLLLPYLRLKN